MADPITKALDFASLVAKYNPDSADLHAKIIPLLLQKSKYCILAQKTHSIIDKLLLALKSLSLLAERHGDSHPKTIPSKVNFFKYWLSQTDDQRKAAVKDDKAYAEAVKEVQALGCPEKVEDLEKLAEQMLAQAKANNNLESVNEYIKLRAKALPKPSETSAKFEEYAVAALTGDALRQDHIDLAENLLRRLAKGGSVGGAFKAKGKEYFKNSVLFNQ